MDEDLKAFGEKLKKLRTAVGLSQRVLVEQLDAIAHARGEVGPLGISYQLIGKWEQAYVHKGRQWKPSRQYVLYLIEAFADQLTIVEAQQWALQAGYTFGKTDLQAFFPPDLDWPPTQAPQLPDVYVNRQYLEATILDKLKNERVQALVLYGYGGTGKTTLATRIAELLVFDFPDGVIWIPVQPEDTVSRILDVIAESLGFISNEDSVANRARRLHSRLRKKRCLLVLDDVSAMPDLAHLRLGTKTSRLLGTTRDAKVAPLLQAASLSVGGLTDDEGLALLTRWAGHQIEGEELVRRLGGLPLALTLAGAQLQAGLTLESLLAAFRNQKVDLSILDMDDPQSRSESLTRCFDVSYQYLDAQTRQRFAQLGYFVGRHLPEAALIAVWDVTPRQAHDTLKKLLRFVFLDQARPGVYRFHPLLQDYARQKLSPSSAGHQAIRRRHAVWHIRYALYHPGILADDLKPAPDLDRAWPDIIAGITWATHHDPQLAAQATLLAHTERPALLEEGGVPFIEAVDTHLSRSTDRLEQAVLHELLGDLYLLRENIEEGTSHFEKAGTLWEMMENGLAASRVKLRVAGTHLLRQDQETAAKIARQAQLILQQCVPIPDDNLAEARTLFYWFNMIYNPLIRWIDLPEADVASLAELARQTGHEILSARGLHIYASYCVTSAVQRPQEIRQRGRDLALEAYFLWRSCDRKEQADSEVSFGKYHLTRRFSRRTAIRFARRRSQQTPRISLSQVRLIKNEGVRWWLEASETQRIDWLSWMLPRYLDAENCPRHPVKDTVLPKLPPESRANRWVKDILNVGMLGQQGRRLMKGQPPPDHLLNGPEWRVLSGQRVLPLRGNERRQLVERYLRTLETQVKSV
jgi:hypothetical protein